MARPHMLPSHRKQNIDITLDPFILKRTKQRCYDEGISVSAQINLLLQKWLFEKDFEPETQLKLNTPPHHEIQGHDSTAKENP
jgi:hypothetical protein